MKIYYRSVGWPVRDNLEIDLIVAGLAERRIDPNGHEAIYVTDAGVRALAGLLSTNRTAFDAHEALVSQVIEHLQQRGWITFTGRSFKVKPEEKWITVRPDVIALPKTLHERRIVPSVYEIKVSRADLRSELRRDAKRLGYEAISRRMYYVMPEEIVDEKLLTEVPKTCGVLLRRKDFLVKQGRQVSWGFACMLIDKMLFWGGQLFDLTHSKRPKPSAFFVINILLILAEVTHKVVL